MSTKKRMDRAAVAIRDAAQRCIDFCETSIAQGDRELDVVQEISFNRLFDEVRGVARSMPREERLAVLSMLVAAMVTLSEDKSYAPMGAIMNVALVFAGTILPVNSPLLIAACDAWNREAEQYREKNAP